MIYKYTKCESVIAKILADLDSTEVQLRITDIREWIFEAIDNIGAPMLYILKETLPLPIIDHLVAIPLDMLVLDGIAYSTTNSGEWLPMLKNNAVFKEPKHNTHTHYESEQVALYKLPTSQSLLYTVNGMKAYENLIQRDYYNEPSYFIKPGWIVTNKENGYVKLSYKAIATDDRGYPLIPDLRSYQEAVYWYVVMKLSFPKYLKGKLGGRGVNNSQNIYFYTQQQWNFYRNQAYAEAMMPTADDMRSIKNDWNKLIPDWDSDDTFFKHQSDRQTVYNDYYYGY